MRKLLLLSLFFPFILLVSCTTGNIGGGENGTKNVEGDLTEILQRIYDNIDSPVELPSTFEQELTHEGTEFNPSVEYFIGSSGIPFTEGLVSEAAVGGAYSVVLLRMEPNADIETAKTEIAEGVDPWKWICMGVDASDVIVDNIGDLVILIMSDHSRELHEAFAKLAV
jgi:hypothetical protein